jgi:hypothetical protein
VRPQAAPQGGGVDEVDERALAADLDDGKPLAVTRLELGVAADVDRAQLEAELRPRLLDDSERPLAQVAALGVVDDDATDRARA